MLALLVCGLWPSVASAQSVPQTSATLRDLYHQAVDNEDAVGLGLAEARRWRQAASPPGSRGAEVITAYEGALTVLKAKYTSWPPAKLTHVRDGLALLDGVVASHPDHLEARYLRLMSCFYLPSFMRREGSVREDMIFLAHRLPEMKRDVPFDLYRRIVAFVLENSLLSAELKGSLERSVQVPPG